MGHFQKGLKYIKSTLKYINSNIDKAIVFNNIARIYFSLNDYSSAIKSTKLCLDNIIIEANIIQKERLSIPNYTLISENRNKVELISFLYYNNAYLLEKAKLDDESRQIYQKGYEFSLSTLGELNLLTNKFRPKLSFSRKITKSFNNISDMRRRSLDSKYDSDMDYFSILDGNVGGGFNILPKLRYVKKSNNNVMSSKNMSVIPVNYFFL